MSSNHYTSSVQLKKYLPVLAVLAVFLLTYNQVIGSLISVWSRSEDHSHGFLIVPIFFYMLWQKRDTLVDIPVSGSNVGGIFFLFSLVIYVVAQTGGILSIVFLSFWLSFVCAIWFLLGTALLKQIAFPLVFLLFMLPVPSQFYAAATGPLQLFVSKVACLLLKSSGVPILCHGNVIEHPEQTFQVVEACSGLRSIMTMLTLGAIVAYFAVKSHWIRALLIVVGIPVAILVNIFRVYILVGFYDWMGLDLTQGAAHTMLGLGIFILSLAMFFLIYRGVVRWDE